MILYNPSSDDLQGYYFINHLSRLMWTLKGKKVIFPILGTIHSINIWCEDREISRFLMIYSESLVFAVKDIYRKDHCKNTLNDEITNKILLKNLFLFYKNMKVLESNSIWSALQVREKILRDNLLQRRRK